MKSQTICLLCAQIVLLPRTNQITENKENNFTATVAQLDRATVSYAVGCGFNSHQ